MGAYTMTFSGDDLVMEQFTKANPGTAIRFVVPRSDARPVATTVEVRAPEELAKQILDAYTRRYDVTVRQQMEQSGVWAGAMDFHQPDQLRSNPAYDALLSHPEHAKGLIIYAEGGVVTLRARGAGAGDLQESADAMKRALETCGCFNVFIRDVQDQGVLQGWRSLLYAKREPFAGDG